MENNIPTVEEIRLSRGLVKNSANLAICRRIREKLMTPEKFQLVPSAELMRRVIAEHNCDAFAFVLKVPNAKYANVAIIPKSLFLAHAEEWLYPSTVISGDQKRDEAGKPCFRFNADALRRDLQFFIVAKLDLEGMTWKSWIKYAQTQGRRQNAGCYGEVKVCELLGWEQIGELDRQGHTIHCDARDAEAKHYEIKLETGYISSQFWTKEHEWRKDDE